jgi:hypothetical protein
MKSFKALSKKTNSVMEHLTHYVNKDPRKSLKIVTFDSQVRTPECVSNNIKLDGSTRSVEQVEDSPFLRAKQLFLNKEKKTSNSNKSICDDCPFEF